VEAEKGGGLEKNLGKSFHPQEPNTVDSKKALEGRSIEREIA